MEIIRQQIFWAKLKKFDIIFLLKSTDMVGLE